MLEMYLVKAQQGRWIEFPYTQEELSEMETKPAPIYIGDIKSSVPGMADYICQNLRKEILDIQTLQEMNFLAARIGRMKDQELELLGAAIQIEKPGTLAAVVNLSCNLDLFKFYSGITTKEALGKYLIEKNYNRIPESLAALLDYESTGHKYTENHAGYFTKIGYVFRTNAALMPFYDGAQALPDPYFETNSPLMLTFHTREYSYKLYLPAKESCLELMRKNLKLSKLDDCEWISIEENVNGLKDRLPCGASVDELNDFAALLIQTQDGTEEQLERLLAALEAESPASMNEAMKAVKELDQYKIFMKPSEYTSPADYAHKAMEDCETYYVDCFTAGFVDFEALGSAIMKEHGAVQTSFGIVVREDAAIHQLTNELITFRLFNPLTANLYRFNEWGGTTNQAEKIDGYALCDKAKEIKASLDKENQWLSEEGGGLADYLDNLILKRKVFSMKPDIDCWDGKLWGVLEVQTYGRLTEGEMKELISEWLGQCSDGWGEGFEQQTIQTEEGELFVSFWNHDDDYSIMPEEQVKAQHSQGFVMHLD